MISFAVWTISLEIPLKEVKLYLIIFLAVTFPVIINFIFFNILLLKLKNIFNAMYLIPITGMILGNSMNGLIITLGIFTSRFFSTYILMSLISKFYFDKYSILDERF
ncbi:MAG: ABC transporter permease [Cetobacterium sp.]|nr:ABC transporter permease [Cetobacterium sp.]